MLQGLRTAVYKVADLDKAKAWYSDLFGIEPYFDEPFYVGYNVGGFELGLDPDLTDVTTGDSVGVYWGVADAKAALEQLRSRRNNRRLGLRPVRKRLWDNREPAL